MKRSCCACFSVVGEGLLDPTSRLLPQFGKGLFEITPLLVEVGMLLIEAFLSGSFFTESASFLREAGALSSSSSSCSSYELSSSLSTPSF